MMMMILVLFPLHLLLPSLLNDHDNNSKNYNKNVRNSSNEDNNDEEENGDELAIR